MPTCGRIHYLEALPPPSATRRGTLLLLHAFPVNARIWEPQFVLAGRGWHVVAPHVRGADGAYDDRPVDTIGDYADDIIELLDSLRIEQAVIVGLSMGGYVAFALMRAAPARIAGLILADTKAEADNEEGLAARRKTLELLEAQGVEAVADGLIPRLLGETTRASRPQVVERVRALAKANSPESIAGMVRALMSRPDSTPLLPAIRVPTLVIVGEEDVITPPESALTMHARIAGAELERIPNAGHLSSLEQPETFNAVLARFLDHRI
jgi:pimeloyl-ACP methyl ester carboxylesterase